MSKSQFLEHIRCLLGKKGFMAIKMEAYDKLRWKFIEETWTYLSLALVRFIMQCFSSTSMRVIWKGRVSDRFKPQRGIRQGDPLTFFPLCGTTSSTNK